MVIYNVIYAEFTAEINPVYTLQKTGLATPLSNYILFREDPMVIAHHLHWHLKMSNRAVPNWHPSNGMNMDR